MTEVRVGRLLNVAGDPCGYLRVEHAYYNPRPSWRRLLQGQVKAEPIHTIETIALIDPNTMRDDLVHGDGAIRAFENALSENRWVDQETSGAFGAEYRIAWLYDAAADQVLREVFGFEE